MSASRSRALAVFAAPVILVGAATTHGTVCSHTIHSPTAVSVSYGQIAASRVTEIPASLSNVRNAVSESNYLDQLGANEHWTHFPLTVAFSRSDLSTASRDVAVTAGFDKWVSATHSRVALQLLNNPAQADVDVSFDAAAARSETHIDFDPVSHAITHATVVIGLEDEDNPRAAISDSDVEGLAAHEFGHALGIDGHSKNASDLMYPTLDNNLSVTARDVNTLRAVYSDKI